MKRRPPPGPDTPQPPPVSAHAGSNAAGRDILNSVALHIENATLPPVEAYGPIPDDAADGGLANLPHGALFVGRSAELDALDAAFEAPGGVVLRAVSGLGGVGKSALAAHWAARRRTARLRWWIGADSPAGFEAGLAGLARALQPGLTGLPQELQRERALAWLAAHDDWLLVLDNVNHPDDVRPLLDRLGGGGRVLVTTRLATGWHHLTATTVRLGVFAPAESVELFRRVLTQAGPRDTDGAAEVCEELGHLALAVEQAAAYCHENGTTPRAYLAMLRSWPAETYATGAETTDADRTVARVWRVTLDRLADTPLAGDVLRTLAWYAPDRIPRVLLDELAPPPVLAKAIGRLVAHSMVTAGADGTLSVHRLVQALARTPDPDDPHRAADAVTAARERATASLIRAVPDEEGPGTWPLERALLTQAEALTGHSAPEDDTEAMAHLLAWMANFLLEPGTLIQAGDLFRRAAQALLGADAAGSAGQDNPEVWTIRSNLASILMEQGEPERATELFEEVLANKRRLQGEDHPDVLALRIVLASAAYRRGDHEGAVALFERALADALRTGGAEHPRTLEVRSRLADMHKQRGNPRQAVAMHEGVLADRIRILGEDHLDTLASREALAGAHESNGNPVLAVPLHRRNLEGHLRSLGEQHPDTLRCREYLAKAYERVGNLARALTLRRRNLADAERHLGRDHATTLWFRHELAHTYKRMERHGESVALYEHNLAERVRRDGENHLDVVRARHFLAGALGQAGEHARALPIYEKILADMTLLLGKEHRETLVARHSVAQTLLVSGKPGVALRLHEGIAADRARILGPDHPETLSSRTEVAMALLLVFRPAEGIALLERTLADCVRALGLDHPQTVELREDLAHAFATVSEALGRSGARSSPRPGPSRGTFR
ncbi:FxSxx-COOH system tetratricopeptide repeat protein [Streptomyces sp. NBC_01335]|uniref:FxSxx-COOH system tetratricopeptide repeat protein n=1 Tax=Streptomyces sp. NBC_01335 TaxID=2903828 RepID=UPI002E0E6A2F|nr:FxSxx-COOH system tetratricopeptide repeat protein [Streptomyces sp. NBC_01335]